jgi:hypothetical protein
MRCRGGMSGGGGKWNLDGGWGPKITKSDKEKLKSSKCKVSQALFVDGTIQVVFFLRLLISSRKKSNLQLWFKGNIFDLEYVPKE